MNIPVAQYWDLLRRYLTDQWPRVGLLTVLLLVSIGLQLVNPQLMRSFIDQATSSSMAGSLLGVAVLFFGLALVQQVVAVLATYVGEDVGWRATNGLRFDLAGHCLHLDLSFHNARTPGELIERIDGDVTALANFFSQFVIQVLGNGLLLLGVLVLLFREGWSIGLTLLAFTLATALVLLRLRGVAVPHWTAARQASAELYGFLEERLAGTQDIRSCGATAYMLRRLYELTRVAWQRTLVAGLMASTMVNATWVLFAVGSAAAFIVAADLVGRGAITIGTAYLIFYYTTLLTAPIERITQQMDDLQKAGASITRVRELTRLQSKVQDGPGAALPAGPLAVNFEHVSFGYDAAELVLHDLSFCLRPGAVLGLLGRTGSGKTTVARLLLRLYDPDQGTICLGDGSRPADIRTARLADLARRVGMVTQTVQLFSATVRDNLILFDRTIGDDRIVQVVHDLGLGAWYRSLAAGLDTRLAADGAGLSAGEAQLLACIRIFLRDPGLIILDEASSRLDPATERLIEQAIDRLLAGRTAIIIAHRLATVARADEIMILDGGRIVEHGPRAALAGDPASHFARLVRTGLDEVLA